MQDATPSHLCLNRLLDLAQLCSYGSFSIWNAWDHFLLLFPWSFSSLSKDQTSPKSHKLQKTPYFFKLFLYFFNVQYLNVYIESEPTTQNKSK